jgi:GTP pyrophosphokinase
MRTIKHLSHKKQERIAIETRDLYAPLAHRLGMNKLKMEYEDLTFQVLDSKSFKLMNRKIKATNKERNRYIDKFIKSINSELKRYNINAQVFGRAKHYYSIFNKMNLQTLKCNELYDLLAIRIIVNKIEECYTVLGIIHQKYTPVHLKPISE